MITCVLTTPIEGASCGMHLMRNKQCQFFNEHVEVLADRYQDMVDRTEKYTECNELKVEFTLDPQHGCGTKTGSEEDFPFFIVPSLYDKKMAGKCTMTFFADHDECTFEMLDDDDRKVS